MNVLAAFFDCSGDRNDLEVSRVYVSLRLICVPDRSLGQAADRAQQHRGLNMIGVYIGAHGPQQVVSRAQTKDMNAQVIADDRFMALSEPLRPIGGKRRSGRRILHCVALRDWALTSLW